MRSARSDEQCAAPMSAQARKSNASAVVPLATEVAFAVESELQGDAKQCPGMKTLPQPPTLRTRAPAITVVTSDSAAKPTFGRCGRRPFRHPTPSVQASSVLLGMLLLCQLSTAAGEGGDDPCARPCGRSFSCGVLNESFTCNTMDLMGCDCTGCCLAALSPLAPPAPPAPPPPPPPPLPPPPSSPSPLFPPLAPGRLAASSMTELRDIVEGLNSNHPATPPFPAAPPSAPPGLPLPQTPPPTPPSQPPPGQPPPPPPEIPPSPPIPPPPPSPPAPPGVPSDSRVVALSGRYLLGGSPLLVRGVGLTLEGVGSEGATIDAEGMSRAIEVTDGASLTLRNIHVVNGNATTTGGGLLVHGAGSSLLMDQADVRDSVSFGAFPEGGGAPGTFRTAHAASDLTADAHCSRLGPHTGPMALSGWPQARDPLPPLPLHAPTHPRHGFASTGGLAVRSGATAVLAGSTIADCASQGGGGGIYASIPTRGSNPGPADSCSSAILMPFGHVHIDRRPRQRHAAGRQPGRALPCTVRWRSGGLRGLLQQDPGWQRPQRVPRHQLGGGSYDLVLQCTMPR